MVYLICKRILKGVIWLSIGTVAELTPVVSPAGLYHILHVLMVHLCYSC